MIRVLAAVLAAVIGHGAHAAGDLSRQDPIEVVVELGQPGRHAFSPNGIELETGKLYKLVHTNRSEAPHYFTLHDVSPTDRLMQSIG